MKDLLTWQAYVLLPYMPFRLADVMMEVRDVHLRRLFTSSRTGTSPQDVPTLMVLYQEITLSERQWKSQS